MANSTATYKEVRFIYEKELTQCYMFIEAGGDSPIGVQGWHHKTFPATMSAVDILNTVVKDSPILWPLNVPE